MESPFENDIVSSAGHGENNRVVLDHLEKVDHIRVVLWKAMYLVLGPHIFHWYLHPIRYMKTRSERKILKKTPRYNKLSEENQRGVFSFAENLDLNSIQRRTKTLGKPFI